MEVSATTNQCAGSCEILFMKNGQLVSKAEFEDKNIKIKNDESKQKSKTKAVPKVQPKITDTSNKNNGSSLEISFMKNGQLVSQVDFDDHKKMKNTESKDFIDDRQKMEDSSLLKKIADLEKQLLDKDKHNLILEQQLVSNSKEKEVIQLELKQTRELNESLKQNINQKNLKIKTLNGKVGSMILKKKDNKLIFKDKVKELRRIISVQKEKLHSKDSTIAKYSKELLMAHNSEANVNKVVKVESLENLHSSNQARGNNIQEFNQEIVRFHNNSSLDHQVCKCKLDGVVRKNNTRLDSLESAVNLLKDQLSIQHNELAQLRDIENNNTGK